MICGTCDGPAPVRAYLGQTLRSSGRTATRLADRVRPLDGRFALRSSDEASHPVPTGAVGGGLIESQEAWANPRDRSRGLSLITAMQPNVSIRGQRTMSVVARSQKGGLGHASVRPAGRRARNGPRLIAHRQLPDLTVARLVGGSSALTAA